MLPLRLSEMSKTKDNILVERPPKAKKKVAETPPVEDDELLQAFKDARVQKWDRYPRKVIVAIPWFEMMNKDINGLPFWATARVYWKYEDGRTVWIGYR